MNLIVYLFIILVGVFMGYNLGHDEINDKLLLCENKLFFKANQSIDYAFLNLNKNTTMIETTILNIQYLNNDISNIYEYNKSSNTFKLIYSRDVSLENIEKGDKK